MDKPVNKLEEKDVVILRDGTAATFIAGSPDRSDVEKYMNRLERRIAVAALNVSTTSLNFLNEKQGESSGESLDEDDCVIEDVYGGDCSRQRNSLPDLNLRLLVQLSPQNEKNLFEKP
jgi:hypothetical protein